MKKLGFVVGFLPWFTDTYRERVRQAAGPEPGLSRPIPPDEENPHDGRLRRPVNELASESVSQRLREARAERSEAER